MSPVALDIVLGVKTLVIKSFFIPVFIFVLEVFILSDTLIAVQIFPPDKIMVHLINQVVCDLHSNLNLLRVCNSILKWDIDHAHELCEP